MLHTRTVEGTTLELLRRLQSESMLDSFWLAGGTALALYLGHRKSIDLDFFTPYPFDVLLLKDFLETKYGFRTDFLEKNTLKIRPFKAITYFDDIDFDESIIMLSGTYDWKHIEKRPLEILGKQDKIFESFPLKKKSISPQKGNGLKL